MAGYDMQYLYVFMGQVTSFACSKKHDSTVAAPLSHPRCTNQLGWTNIAVIQFRSDVEGNTFSIGSDTEIVYEIAIIIAPAAGLHVCVIRGGANQENTIAKPGNSSRLACLHSHELAAFY